MRVVTQTNLVVYHFYKYGYMISKCRLLVGPGCKSGYPKERKKCPKIKYGWHKFPSSSTNLALRKKWPAAMPRVEFDGKEYDPPGHARLCRKHFIPSDYELMHKNTNVMHRITNNGLMKRGELKPNAVQSVWPGCAARLTKTKNERPTKMATSQARDEQETAVRKELLEEHIHEDRFDSVDGLQVNLMYHLCLMTLQ